VSGGLEGDGDCGQDDTREQVESVEDSVERRGLVLGFQHLELPEPIALQYLN
jgi:hypothetical protein